MRATTHRFRQCTNGVGLATLLVVALGALTVPARALQTSIPSRSDTTVHRNWIAADGSFLTAAKGGEGLPAEGSIGFLHEAIPGKKDAGSIEQFELYITAAGTSDTVSGSSGRTFAASLLPATVTGHRPSLQASYMKARSIHSHPNGNPNWDQLYGLRAYAGWSQVTWSCDSLGTAITSNIDLLSGGVRFVIVPIHQVSKTLSTDKEEGYVSVMVEAGLTGRYVMFDNEGGDRLRALSLGGEKRVVGGELAVSLQLRDFVTSAYFPMFYKRSDARDLPGLTGLHPRIQFSLTTKLVPL